MRTETREHRIVYYLGGSHTSGVEDERIRSPLAVHTLIKHGLPVACAQWARDHFGLARRSFNQVRPRQTLESAATRRDQRLTPAQSEKLLRLARLYAIAEETFGDRDRAAHWMNTPNTALAGARPAELSETESGAASVEQMLGRLAHGIAA